MSDGIYLALGGAVAQQRSLDVVANNVANANTVGFRADRVAFSEAVSRATGGREALPPTVEVGEVRFDPTSGSLENTGAPLDVALQGDGYLAVETPAGERYTRSGSMVLDRDGTLRTHAGHAVLDASGAPIVLPRDVPIEIGTDGTIHAGTDVTAQLRIVEFRTPNAVVKEGLTFFAAAPGARPEVAERTEVVQGHLESANVNVVAGMNELISAGRSFEAFQKIIHGFKDIDQRTVRDLAGPQ